MSTGDFDGVAQRSLRFRLSYLAPTCCPSATPSSEVSAAVYVSIRTRRGELLHSHACRRLEKWGVQQMHKNVGMMSKYSDVTLGGKVDFLRAPCRLRDEERRSTSTRNFCFVRTQMPECRRQACVKTESHVTVTSPKCYTVLLRKCGFRREIRSPWDKCM
jgi:hypothetical protein